MIVSLCRLCYLPPPIHCKTPLPIIGRIMNNGDARTTMWNTLHKHPPIDVCKSWRFERAQKQIIQVMLRHHVHVPCPHVGRCSVRTILAIPKHFKSFSSCLHRWSQTCQVLGGNASPPYNLEYKPATPVYFDLRSILFSYQYNPLDIINSKNRVKTVLSRWR